MSSQTSLFDTGGPAELPDYVRDICARKHGGNEMSREAYHAADRDNQRAAVLQAIEAAGDDGLTVDELAAKWEVSPNAISGRFSELKKDEAIYRVGTRKTRSGSSAGAWAKY